MTDDSDPAIRLTAWASGRVQGVGFRFWVRTTACRLGLHGSATNLDDGSVKVVAEGRESQCLKLLAALDSGVTPGRVTRVTYRWSDATGELTGFVER
ncbi:MAG TPA: acylphosphatase [Trebonia sp.]|nr:acylphosphatase [Trebonia sp.]